MCYLNMNMHARLGLSLVSLGKENPRESMAILF